MTCRLDWTVRLSLLLVTGAVLGAAPLAITPAGTLLKVLELPGIGVPKEAPPQYMLELYSDAALTTTKHRGTPYQATSITAVTAADGKRNAFYFFAPNISKWEKLVEVEFHLHHAHLRSNAAVDMYKVVASAVASGSGNSSSSGSDIQLMSSQSTAGWLKFRMGSEAFAEQQRNCHGNYCSKVSIVVTVTATNMDGKAIKMRLHHGDRQRDRKPLLVFFTRPEFTNTSLPSLLTDIDMFRIKKTEDNHSRQRRSILGNTQQSTTSSGTHDQSSSSSFDHSSNCQRNSLMVNFEEIGWSSWILHPSMYNAYYCSGSCGFPLGQHLNPTNHAVVQSIMRTMGGEQVPTPYCVPRAYTDLSLLYYDPEGNVVLRNYEQMVVESCGCH